MLKPQDTLLLLKYWSLRHSDQSLSLRHLQDAIGISASEASKGARRLQSAKLLVNRDKGIFVEQGALLEWLGYGVRYAYSAEVSGFGRGMPTGWNCPLIQSEMLPPSPPMVWAQPRGVVEGVYLKPIHSSVPLAASKDELLYQIFALVDVIRMGKSRELGIARDLLEKLVKGK